MTTASQSRRVAAPPEKVWALLADFDRICEWAPAVDHSTYLTTQTAGVGTSRRAQVGRTTLVETITIWDERRSLSYRIDGLPPIVELAENTWDLAADGEATMVTLTVNIIPGRRPPAKLAAKAVVRRFASANSGMLEGLAAALEHR